MIFTKVVSNKSIYETQIIEAKIVFICVGLSQYSALQSYSLVQRPTQDLSVVQARTPGSAFCTRRSAFWLVGAANFAKPTPHFFSQNCSIDQPVAYLYQ